MLAALDGVSPLPEAPHNLTRHSYRHIAAYDAVSTSVFRRASSSNTQHLNGLLFKLSDVYFCTVNYSFDTELLLWSMKHVQVCSVQ